VVGPLGQEQKTVQVSREPRDNIENESAYVSFPAGPLPVAAKESGRG
jgi:hypothetical protein